MERHSPGGPRDCTASYLHCWPVGARELARGRPTTTDRQRAMRSWSEPFLWVDLSQREQVVGDIKNSHHKIRDTKHSNRLKVAQVESF